MNRLKLTALICGSLLLLSMGEPVEPPVNLRKVKISVVDREGQNHNLTGLRCSDGYELNLRKGDLRYRITLSDLRRLEVLESDDEDHLKVRVVLKNGKEGTFSIDSSTKCYSYSDLGNVDFYLANIKYLEILEVER